MGGKKNKGHHSSSNNNRRHSNNGGVVCIAPNSMHRSSGSGSGGGGGGCASIQSHGTSSEASNSSSRSGGSTTFMSEPLDSSKFDFDFNQVLQQDRNSFRVTWKDALTLSLVVLAVAGLSIFIGIAAGISISIQYYDSAADNVVSSIGVVSGGVAPSMDRFVLDMQGGHALASTQRVTILDPSIALSNSLNPSNGRIIHTSPSGHQSYEWIVEESPMSSTMTTTTATTTTTTDNYNNNGTDGDSSSTTSHYYSTSSISSGFRRSSTTTTTTTTRRFNDWNNLQDHHQIPVHNGPSIQPPRMNFEEWTTVHPKLCSDGNTVGFDSWEVLHAAMNQANQFSAERFIRWNQYYAMIEQGVNADTFQDDSIYYEDDIVFTICPGAVLKSKKKGPMFINAESVVLQCDGCTFQTAGGSHLSFGPEARYAVVKGITFIGADSSSILFYHNGAEASFEDCTWIRNKAKVANWGSVADVNSSSVVNFYRCFVEKALGKEMERSSSLSIRQS